MVEVERDVKDHLVPIAEPLQVTVEFEGTGVEGKSKEEGDETIHEKDSANLDVFEISQIFPWRQAFSREPQLLCVTRVRDAS